MRQNSKKNKYIVSPILFNNIYKGALGEVVGRFILERELNMKLIEIEDFNEFEFFDFKIKDGVYIDFKHWRQGYTLSREKTLNEIKQKLEYVKGQRVYIINILGDEKFNIGIQKDEKIIEIPYLIDSRGEINKKVVEMLLEESDYDLYK